MDPRGEEVAAGRPRHCRPCNAPRDGDRCFKCGAELIETAAGWDWPRLPPVDRIRALAREVGYAIGEHGSRQKDLDLIAAPWTASAVDPHNLVTHIARGIGATLLHLEKKPLGRVAFTLQMDGWYKDIDLSVMPRGATLEQSP